MSTPNFVSFNLVSDNSVVRLNSDGVVELSAVPAGDLPTGVTDGTEIRYGGGYVVRVRGTVAATQAALLTSMLVKTVSTATYAISDDDNGKLLIFTNGGGCTVTVPQGLSAGVSCNLQQNAAAQVTITAGAGETLQASVTYTAPYKTADQYSVVGLTVIDSTHAALYGELA